MALEELKGQPAGPVPPLLAKPKKTRSAVNWRTCVRN